MEIMMEYLARGFMIMLMVSLPCVLVTAGIGLIVGILQAITQVQEQTIAAAPKILFVFLTIIVLGGWYVKIMQDYVIEGTHLAFEIIPKDENMVLPPDYYKHTKPFLSEMNENKATGSNFKNFLNTSKINDIQNKNKTKYQKSNRDFLPKPDFMERKKIEGR